MLTVATRPSSRARRSVGRLVIATGVIALAACTEVPDVSNRIETETTATEWPSLLPQSDLLPITTTESQTKALYQAELMARAEVLLAKPSLSAADRAELRRILAELGRQP